MAKVSECEFLRCSHLRSAKEDVELADSFVSELRQKVIDAEKTELRLLRKVERLVGVYQAAKDLVSYWDGVSENSMEDRLAKAVKEIENENAS